jgi:16S rRNA U516 pseudouridylate synthase RsuA-like enzyme
MQELIKATEQMKVLIVEGRRHVVRPFQRSFGNQEEGFVVKRANYLNTGKALCGVLSSGQTLDAFKQEWIDRRLKGTG